MKAMPHHLVAMPPALARAHADLARAVARCDRKENFPRAAESSGQRPGTSQPRASEGRAPPWVCHDPERRSRIRAKPPRRKGITS